MAFEHYYSQEWKSIPSAMTETESCNGCFDCNICLDFAHEPVVTLCGHLYCWPCIYKWLHVQSSSLASDEHPQCPVCKAEISHATMVPLYGRGQASAQSEDRRALCQDIFIPPRPPAFGAQALLPASSSSHGGHNLQHSYRSPLYQEEDASLQMPIGATITPPGLHHPLAGMVGEMVYARVFGNSENVYSYPNSYHPIGSNSLRLRRQEMQADKSLNRISIFLFCCFLLCLIVF
ncbi:E3 ubiquitin-protein ligase RMA1H1-like [Senna tora]|uniref:E3 ubiquitin-protein ligase RMA n=1 Tax=Senna tora TaxID=362788 RepID=A0A834SH55_9FABA|nr:E3 ubiquitin-protein ligase RMA1H1-like [Senna tora]